MREIYYQTLCGCIKLRGELIHGPNSIHRRLICPEHSKTLEYKFGFCKKCGAKIKYKTPQSKIPLLCLECDPIRRRKKEYQERQKLKTQITASEEEIIDIMMERSECEFRPLCFQVNLNKPSLPCFHCTEYKKKSYLAHLIYDIDLDELDQFIKKIHNNQDETIHKELFDRGRNKWATLFEKRERDLQKKGRPI